MNKHYRIKNCNASTKIHNDVGTRAASGTTNTHKGERKVEWRDKIRGKELSN